MISPELDKAMADMVNKATEAGKDVASFFIEQAPDVAKQFVEWKAMTATIGLIENLVILLFFAGLIIWSVSMGRKCNKCDSTEPARTKRECADNIFAITGVIVGFGLIPLGLCFCFAIENITTIAKCKVAPKVVLLQGISNIAKGQEP